MKIEIKKLGYRVVYVPHRVVKEHIACYNVSYKGKTIYPPVCKKMRIPINEIWVSRKFKRYEKFILFHELKEIKYRARGYDRKSAHKMARRDEILLWKNNIKWKKLNSLVEGR
jgi:competence protein ComEA